MNLEIYIERIEQYESGQMTAAERSAFEAELSTNAELKQAHTFFLGANEVIEQGIENSLRNQLNDWAAAEAGTSAKPAKTKVVSMQTTWVRMAIAASVTLLIGWFGLQWMSNQYTDQALYSGFYEKPGDSTFRGGPSEHPLKLGYEAFQKNDFAAAVSFFNSIPDSRVITNLKTKMTDAREVSSETPFGSFGTFNGFKFCEPVQNRIDYIFISNGGKIKVNKYAVLTDSKDMKYPSDHFPVFAELLFK